MFSYKRLISQFESEESELESLKAVISSCSMEIKSYDEKVCISLLYFFCLFYNKLDIFTE